MDKTAPTSLNGLTVGQRVKLKPEIAAAEGSDPDATAPIRLFYSNIEGGVRLEQPLARFVSWNVADLVAAGA